MVNNQKKVSAIFAALSDPTRRRILTRLSGGREEGVSHLAKPFKVSLPAVSRHLRVLEAARLIERRKDGRIHVIRARAEGLKPAQDWLKRYEAAWDYSFDRLDELLKAELGKE